MYNNKKKGLGSAIEVGLIKSTMDYVCVFMADMSDDLSDLKKYYKLIKKDNLDAVLGTRFSDMSKIKDYPKIKLILNRIFNNFVSIRKPENFLFGIGIDFINRFFSDNKITTPVKNLILRDINKFKFLKNLSLNLSNKGIFY